MKNLPLAQIALNLSYVLHDRSDSATVQAYVRNIETERRVCQKALSEFVDLSDAGLMRRLVVLDETTPTVSGDPHGVWIVSVDIGVTELMPRLLNVAGIVGRGVPMFGSLLDGSSAIDGPPLEFFGATARLSTPSISPDSCERMLFASAVLRPGHASILLRATSLPVDERTGEPLWQSAARMAETIIRDFPLQWWCQRPLWAQPVEQTLPEFRSIEDGATICGR